MRGWLQSLWTRLRSHSGRQLNRDIEEEYAFHLRMSTERNLRRGMSPEEARREALLRFGSITRFQEEGREVQRRRLFEGLGADIRYALRALRRSPGFAVSTVLTLALGMGANTAIFSVVNGVLLRPLPFPHPGRVAALEVDWDRGHQIGALPAYEFAWFREHAQLFDGMMTFRSFERELGGSGGLRVVRGMQVSEDFFRVTGMFPRRGRAFEGGEVAPSGPLVAILSDGMWRREFGADAGVIGKYVQLDDATYTIIGVMPEEFRFPAAPDNTDILIPLVLAPNVADEGMNWTVLVRRKAGVEAAAARAEMVRLSEAFRNDHPQLKYAQVSAVRMVSYTDLMGGNLRKALWILFGAVGFVLLIACANAANLLLVRATSREREIAVRAAIGASRGRVAQQMLVESILLALVAGALGVGLAAAGLDAVLALAPSDLPRADEIELDARVLAFTFVLSAATGVLFGLAAVPQSRPNLSKTLAGSGRGNAPAKQRIRGALIIAETALAVVLLAGAALLLDSFARLRSLDPGFEAEGVIAMRYQRMPRDYDEIRRSMYERQVLERIGVLPGVESVAALSNFPLERGINFPVAVAGRADTEEGAVELRGITPSYFQTLRIPLARGRAFQENDGTSAPRVAIINQAYARQYFPNEDPIGQRIEIGRWRGRWLIPAFEGGAEVVGVVADVREIELGSPPRRTVYLNRAQLAGLDGFLANMAFIVRANASSALRSAITSAVQDIDPRVPAPRLETMKSIVSASLSQERFQMVLIGLFAASALVLTLIGVYSVVSYAVNQQVREIGIRMALGARASQVLAGVLGRSLALVGAGALLGTATALGLTRFLAGMLFGVKPTDVRTYAVVLTILGVSALMAAWFPSRRAARTEPTVSLRSE